MAVRSGRLFPLLKLIGDYKIAIIRSREVAVPERLLYIEVIVYSFNPGHLWPFYSV